MSTNPALVEIAEQVATLTTSLYAWDLRSATAQPTMARAAAVEAIASIDVLIIRLHRLRDRTAIEVRRFDRETRPHDDRD